MGGKWTVEAWGQWRLHGGSDEHSNQNRYRGPSMLAALLACWKAYHEGIRCITLEIRP